MASITKDEFKKAVTRAFEERGYTRVRISMSLFGMQCGVTYRQEGEFGKQEAHVYFKEKDGRRYLDVCQENGIDWERDIPEV